MCFVFFYFLPTDFLTATILYYIDIENSFCKLMKQLPLVGNINRGGNMAEIGSAHTVE